MKTILSILSILVFSLGFGQTLIKKSSISTGGGSATSGNIQVIYTIGETAVQEAHKAIFTYQKDLSDRIFLHRLAWRNTVFCKVSASFPIPYKTIYKCNGQQPALTNSIFTI